MKPLLALIALCAISCEPDEPLVITRPDALPVDADVCQPFWSSSCNVTTQSGCDVDGKCTWVRVSTDPAAPASCRGAIVCAPAGDVPVGGSCSYGPSGRITGYDDCVRGAICVASEPTMEEATGICAPVCSLADSSAPCDPGFACVVSPLLFHNNPDTEMAAAGVCTTAGMDAAP